MQGNQKKRLLEQVQRFRARFAQSVGTALGEIIPRESLIQGVIEEVGVHRERIYSPLTTLLRFIEQVLGADHGCQDAVARGLSTRVVPGNRLAA